MRKWSKPEMVIEEFELTQHVALGCSVPIKGEVTVHCVDKCNGNGHKAKLIVQSDADKKDFYEKVDSAIYDANGGNGHPAEHGGYYVVCINGEHTWISYEDKTEINPALFAS